MEDSTDVKTCTKCGTDKSEADFPYGRSACRDCQNAYRRNAHAARPEARNAGTRKWKAENADQVRHANKRRRESNPERARAAGRRQYASDPGKHRARKQSWAENNPDKREAAVRRGAASQGETLTVAQRRGYVWSGWELELLADETRKAKDLALQLGRTLAAVYHMRYCIRHDPATIARAYLSESGTL